MDGEIRRIRDEEGHIREFSSGDSYFKMTDALGCSTFGEKDEQGNLVLLTDPEGNTVKLDYDDKGEITRIKTRTGETITIARPDAGTISMNTSDGPITTYTLDDWGRITAETDTLGNTAQVSYDLKGRPITLINKNGSITTFSWDPEDNLISIQDPLGNEKSFQYNGLNRLIRRRDANGHTIRFVYSTNQTLAEIINENGENHTYEYDALRRVILEKGFDNQSTAYTYDTVGNLTGIRRPDGNRLILEYDRKSRLIRVRKSHLPDSVPLVEYTYDPADNLVAAQNEHSLVTFRYNKLGQLIEETQHGHTLFFRRDPDGNLMDLVRPWSGITCFERDTSGRLTKIGLSNRQEIGFNLDALGRPESISFPNEISFTNSYDPTGALTRKKFFIKGTEAGNRLYMRNEKGQVEKFGDYYGGRIHSWDKAGRLRGVSQITKSLSESFELDPSGNLLLKDNTFRGRYDRGNILTSFGPAEYATSPNGMRTKKTDPSGITHYSYTFLDQLSAVQPPDGSICYYLYDALGRRIIKSDTKTARTTRYYWLGFQLLSEDLLPQEIDFDRNTAKNCFNAVTGIF